MDSTKKCYSCQIEKSKSCFAFKNKKLGTLQGQCKECQSKYHRQHYIDNKSYYQEKRNRNNKKYRYATRKFINDFKEKSACLFCGENTTCCLDFHHLDPKIKDSNISKMQIRKISVVKEEIEKCIVVCSNCHRKIHAGIINCDTIRSDISNDN